MSLTPAASPAVSITVSNNAAGTGYGSSETAAPASKNVPYRVVVTNSNSASGKITALTDTVNGQTMNICPDLIGASLAPAVAATCDFSGPVPTKATTLAAAVTLSVGSALATGSGTTTVFPPATSSPSTTAAPPTAPPATQPLTLTPGPAAGATGTSPAGVSATGAANPALATTGAPVKNLVIWMTLLLFTGLCLLTGLEVTDPRRRLVPVPVAEDHTPTRRSVPAMAASSQIPAVVAARSARRAPHPDRVWRPGYRWQTGWWSPAALTPVGEGPGSGWSHSWPPPPPGRLVE